MGSGCWLLDASTAWQDSKHRSGEKNIPLFLLQGFAKTEPSMGTLSFTSLSCLLQLPLGLVMLAANENFIGPTFL
jgi:hypothetical protein